MTAKKFGRGSLIVCLLAIIAGCVLVIIDRQAVVDWLKLRNYTAPAAVQSLAAEDTMTGHAEHLFYVNHPDITRGQDFTSHCPSGSEKTVVLGCYVGNDAGIYIYSVTDPRLQGVEQVTAAHEMLHAAYRRLSAGDKAEIDAMLQNYYDHDLTDQRVKDVIAAYKKSEPHDVINEMHSVFGTEVANLPGPLEQYYAQYFTDRSKVTGYAAAYESEFTSRQEQLKAYDAQLGQLKSQIDMGEQSLKSQEAALNSQDRQLTKYQQGQDYTDYNALAPAYNAAVDRYRAEVQSVKALIHQYNDIVSKRNAIALQEAQLMQDLSAGSVPSQ